MFGDYNSNEIFGRGERFPSDPTSSDSNLKNNYRGSSNIYNRKGRNGDGGDQGLRYPNYLSASDYAIKILSRQQQHYLALKYLFHILTVLVVTNSLT